MDSWGEQSTLPVIQRAITLEQIAAYADASGDYNPVHLDPEFASSTQFGGIVAHGMLTLAFVSEMLTLAFGRCWIETGRLKVRFKAPAFPGDTVRTWGEVVKMECAAGHLSIQCSVGLRDSRDKDLITGAATVTLTDPRDGILAESPQR